MAVFTCCSSAFKSLSRAAAKSAKAQLRRAGIFATTVNWSQRAAICERCPLRVIHRGTSYCGRPFLEQIHRIPAEDGCGCPCADKAKSPGEHCPVDPHNRPATTLDNRCTCKWCHIA